MRCYGEHVGEHVGNLRNILTSWREPIGNLKEHIRNQGKMKKRSLPKRVCHQFWPGLITSCKEHPTYWIWAQHLWTWKKVEKRKWHVVNVTTESYLQKWKYKYIGRRKTYVQNLWIDENMGEKGTQHTYYVHVHTPISY